MLIKYFIRVVVKSKPPFQIVHCNGAYTALAMNRVKTVASSDGLIGSPFIGGNRMITFIKNDQKQQPSSHEYGTALSRALCVTKAYAIRPTKPKSVTESGSESKSSQASNLSDDFDFFLLEVDEKMLQTSFQQKFDYERPNKSVQESLEEVLEKKKQPCHESSSPLYDDVDLQVDGEENLWLDDPDYVM